MKRWMRFTMLALSFVSSILGVIETSEARKNMKNEITKEVLKELTKAN